MSRAYEDLGLLFHFASGNEVNVGFNDWAEKIQENFEKHFWINTTPVPDNEPRPDLINKRGIYKDSFGASQDWADYQLRPNFPIAMVVVSLLL